MLSLRQLLGLPSYLFGVGLMYWCFELATLCGFVRFWQLGPRRNDVSAAVRFLKWAFKFRVLRLGRNEVYRGRCMYLVNHRCWADFFIDMYVVGCRGVPLSRRAVGMAFPAFTASLLSLRSILLFNRAKTQDKDKFNSWLDRELSKGPQNCLLVYPEGKRSQQNTSLPLKRGMLHYAYTRKLPVQAVVTSNKEEVLNESRMWAHFGRTLVTGSSEVLESSRFDDFESFMAAVQALWDAQWQAVHSAPQHGLAELPEPVAAGGEYSGNQLAAQSAFLIFWMAVMVGLGRIVLRVLAALAAHSLVGRCVVAALVLHVVASLLAAALLPPPAKRSRRSSNGASVASGGAVGASSESEKEL